MFEEEELFFPFPHGTPIAIDDIPPDLISPGSLPEGTTAERLGDSGAYRLEYPDGTITVVGPDGAIQGGVI